MNKKQLKHYLKGGKFSAIYRPKVIIDIDSNSKGQIGNEIIVWQNIIVSPIITPAKFRGQHAFNADEIDGWFPEEDIKKFFAIGEFNPELPPVQRQILSEILELRKEQGIGISEGDMVGASNDGASGSKQKTVRQSTPRKGLTLRASKQKSKGLLRR